MVPRPYHVPYAPTLVAGLALALGSACSGDRSERAPAMGPVDLLAEAREPEDAPRGDATLSRFTVGVDTPAEEGALHPWTTRGPRPATVALHQPKGGAFDRFAMTPAAVLRGAGPKSFEHPCAVKAGEARTVVALVWCLGRGTERVRAVVLDVDGRAHEASPWQVLERGPAPQLLELSLPGARDVDGAPRSGVRLEFEGRGDHVALASLAVLSSSWAQRGPRVGAPALVGRGTDQRRAARLTEGLAWTVDLGQPGGADARPELVLSLAAPDPSPAGGRVFASVRADGNEIFATSFDVGEIPRGGWWDGRVALPANDGSARTLELMVEDADPSRTASVLVADAHVVAPVVDPPTVLLVTSDTHRADYISAGKGPSRVSTPVLEGLARRGLCFDAAYSTTNITNPSHIAVMTGLHPRDTRIVDNNTRLAPAAKTLAEVFGAAGYRTFAAISTQHLGPAQSGLGQGFGRFDAPETKKRDGRAALETIERWIRSAPGEPVFAWVHVFDAHAPYDLSPEDELALEIPRTAEGGLGPTPEETPQWIRRAGVTNPRFVNALYAAEVEYVDASLHSLLSLGRMERAAIAFTADHGESLTENEIYWSHSGAYLPTLAVPLIVAHPNLERAVSTRPVQQHQLGRTLLELAGVAAEFPGASLVEAASTSRGLEPVFGLSSFGLQATVTLGDWHLVFDLRSFESAGRPHVWRKGRTQLFDRREGLATQRDRSGEHPERTAEMRAALLDWLSRGSARGLGADVQLTDSAAQNLKALGYAGFTEPESDWYDAEGH